MTEYEMIKRMLEKQSELNSLVNVDWKQRNNRWYRALWLECAEMMEWTNWKWWKTKKTDLNQLKIEAVDIFHFGMSTLLVCNPVLVCLDYIQLYSKHIKIYNEIYRYSDELLNYHIEEIALKAIHHREFNIESFMKILGILQMSMEDLYKLYMGKNILNVFRQDNGYKQGVYSKTWNGKEDNDYMFIILESMSVDSVETKLYEQLKMLYELNQTIKMVPDNESI